MEHEKLFEVLDDWNFWNKKIDSGVKRENYLDELVKLASTGQVVTVVGARRVGKSTLLRQYAELLAEKGVDKKNVLFVNLEDPRFSGELTLELLLKIYETYLEYLEPSSIPHVFLDEVQLVTGWEKFVRSLHERKEAHIYVSGSSSKLLSKELGTVLTGRHVTLEVFPLSFEEYLIFNKIKLTKKQDLVSKKTRIKKMLKQFIETGSFPHLALGSNKKEEVLTRYLEDILMRDISQRYKLRETEKLKKLAKYYLSNISSHITFNSIKKFLNMPVDTVERFSDYIASAYLVFFVTRYSHSLKEQYKSPRKVYCIDTGLRNITSFSVSKDSGKLMENIVFIELLRRKKEIFYWADEKQKEVDFLIRKKNRITELIQVCESVSDDKTKERETKALLKAMALFKIKEACIITSDSEKTEAINSKKIHYIPLWKWLLNKVNWD